MSEIMTLRELDKKIEGVRDQYKGAKHEADSMYEALSDGYGFDGTSNDDAWRIQGEWSKRATSLCAELRSLEEQREALSKENMSIGHRRIYSSIASQIGYKLEFEKNIQETTAIINGESANKMIKSDGTITFRKDTLLNSIELHGEDGILARVNSNLAIASRTGKEENTLMFIIRDKSHDEAISITFPSMAKEGSKITVSFLRKPISNTKLEDSKTMLIQIKDGRSIVVHNNVNGQSEIGYSIDEYMDCILEFLRKMAMGKSNNNNLMIGIELVSPALRLQTADYLIEGVKCKIEEIDDSYCTRRQNIKASGSASPSQIEEAQNNLKQTYDNSIGPLRSQLDQLYNEMNKTKNAQGGYGGK